MLRRAAGLILVGSSLSLLAARPVEPPTAVHRVQMTSNRYEPAELTVREGDTVRFVNARGGPHNIQFFDDSMTAAARHALALAMPGDKIGPLSSPLLILDDAAYDITVPALPPGRYAFVCRPHFAARMSGALIVEGGDSRLVGTWRQVLVRVH